MSAFIVSDKVFCEVAAGMKSLAKNRMINFRYSDEQIDDFVRELRDLNVAGVNHRYNDNTELPPLKIVQACPVRPLQLYKYVQGIRYQCLEGISELPADLKTVFDKIAHSALQLSSAYEEAAWV